MRTPLDERTAEAVLQALERLDPQVEVTYELSCCGRSYWVWHLGDQRGYAESLADAVEAILCAWVEANAGRRQPVV